MNTLAWLQNPVAVKELRSRMRGGSAYWGMTAYALTLSAVAGFALLLVSGAPRPMSSAQLAQWGHDVFLGLAVFQLYLASFVAPTLTAGAITRERERLTLDLLRITRLGSADIVLGKLASSLFYLMLLIASSVPVCALTFLLGGVSPLQMMAAYVVIASTAVLFGAVGMSLSAVCQRTTTAVFLACVAPLFFMVMAPYTLVTLVTEIMSRLGYQEALWIAMASLLAAVPIALAVALVLRRALARLWLMGGRALSWLVFLFVAAVLTALLDLVLTAQRSWFVSGIPLPLGFHPVTVVVSIVMGVGTPLSSTANSALYWFGMAAFYLLAAADLIALGVLSLERVRVRG